MAIQNNRRDLLRVGAGALAAGLAGSFLLADDLDAEDLAARAEAVEGVQTAAPVLWSGGLLSTPRESIGIEIVGLNPQDAFHAPIREGIAAGEYLTSDDRGRILIGKILADQMDFLLAHFPRNSQLRRRVERGGELLD